MARLELELQCDSTKKRIAALVRNVSSDPVTIGNLTLANLKIGPHEDTAHYASPWVSTHLPNADGQRMLGPHEAVVNECDYLREFEFPGPGMYRMWLVYESLGFPVRFHNGEGHHAGLEKLDEFRCKSDETLLTISESDHESNQLYLARRRAAFFGKALGS